MSYIEPPGELVWIQRAAKSRSLNENCEDIFIIFLADQLISTLGKKKILFVDQKTFPTALLQVCTVISMNGRAKGNASKMGNEVELGLNVLSISLMLQAVRKPRASAKLISQ